MSERRTVYERFSPPLFLVTLILWFASLAMLADVSGAFGRPWIPALLGLTPDRPGETGRWLADPEELAGLSDRFSAVESGGDGDLDVSAALPVVGARGRGACTLVVLLSSTLAVACDRSEPRTTTVAAVGLPDPPTVGEPGEPGEPASRLPAEAASPADLDQLQPGDVIFHVSRSAQSKAIQLATRSPYSHVGIVEAGPDGLVVLEAVQPVKRTPVGEWIARGLGGRFVVKRLKRAGELLTPEAVLRLRAAGARFIGKRYDTAFGWSDDRVYCSELVYKVYHQALGIELGSIQRLREFDLSSPIVQKKLVERYGARIPLNEPVVSPAGIFDSPALTTVLDR